MSTENKLAVGLLADRFITRNPEVKVSHGFKAALVAGVAALVMSMSSADAQAQEFTQTEVGSGLSSAVSGLKQVGGGLFNAAKAMVGGSGLADLGKGVVTGATNAGARVVAGGAELAQKAGRAAEADGFDDTPRPTVGQFEEVGEQLAKEAVSVKKGRLAFGTKEWKVQTKAGKDGLTQVVNAQGDSMWLNAAGKPTDPRPGVPAIQHADGGFEHFQNGKLAAPAGQTLVARFGRDGFEFHIKDGELQRAAPVVEATVKPVRSMSMAMR